MARASTRTFRVPHTDKRPERCPHCGSTHVAKKGTRKKKIEIVQLWRCASCKRIFTPSPAALRNKTYPLHVVLDAITLYDLGYSLEQVAEKIRSRFGRRAGRSTIAAWLADPQTPSLLAQRSGERSAMISPPSRFSCRKALSTRTATRFQSMRRTSAAFRWLYNRQPHRWRDRQQLDMSGTIEHRIAAMTPEERAADARAFGERLRQALIEARRSVEQRRTIEGEGSEVEE